MSRTKKSRKPGAGAIGVVKEKKNADVTPVARKPKKKKGKPSGNRQQEAVKQKKQSSSQAIPKDPRIGNKTPIDLGQGTKPASVTTSTSDHQSKSNPAAIARVYAVEKAEASAEPSTINEQIIAIEQDEKLLSIIEKQETEQALSSEEVDYFNELMEQHQQLTSQLPEQVQHADDESALDDEQDSEQALWQKFDNSDFSAFEE